MANRSRRVMKEIQDCQKDIGVSHIDIEPVGSDMSKLRGKFPGPPNSPYEGGIFEVSIDIPDRYPFEPLKMKFITKVYHPNVSSQSGAICLDILKDAWSPVLTLKTTLVSLQSLLCSPEPNDPQDAEVAKVYLTDRATFERTARYWTETYAKGTKPSSSSSNEIALAGLNPAYVQQFETMGFQRHQIIEVMKKLNYRGKNVSLLGEDAVIEALLSA
ncbi:uncharacterized protein MELLADRAFT_37906 [Melampsora larici-populina 98AG31]|uniref:Ubiquitin-conjugating enzyme E2 1 n=1 Tax=Melampsora larici-populina (strain 98AG31 / pathotype 3-4-7) TaxID=747676 RepID=F4RVB6_MELLP|nr:uncharacterized protein MELLADRAFT_37906 [Melampsora larici-populina 98AG31]EGG03698.1 hypothetical protein MELLADRAFT_37906 [Melampsora larici-populina 98AG31]